MSDNMFWLVVPLADTDAKVDNENLDNPVVFTWVNVDADVAYPIFTNEDAAHEGWLACRSNTHSQFVDVEAVPATLVGYFIAQRRGKRFAIDPTSTNEFVSVTAEQALADLRAAGFNMPRTGLSEGGKQ